MKARKNAILFSWVIVVGLVPFCVRNAVGQPPASQSEVVIHDGVYPGWPWVTAGKDGTLFCVFREGTVHEYSSVGKVMFTRSSDQGRSWSRAVVIVDAPEVDDRNAAIVELPDGRLLVTYNSYTAAKVSTAMTVFSADGGKTWTSPRSLGIPNTRNGAAALSLGPQTLILPPVSVPGNGSIAARSVDGGLTWQGFWVPDAVGFLGDEWDLLEVEPGRLIGLLRNNQPKSDGTFWKTESRDGGRHWTEPRPTNVQSRRASSPPHLLRHGRSVVLVYSDRRMVSMSAVRTADPEYLTWDLDHRLQCYLYNRDETPILDGSYPSSVRIDQTHRMIADYEIRPGSARITGHLIKLPDRW